MREVMIMTLRCFAIVMDDDRPAWCVLCGAKFINMLALDDHFFACHQDFDRRVTGNDTRFR